MLTPTDAAFHCDLGHAPPLFHLSSGWVGVVCGWCKDWVQTHSLKEDQRAGNTHPHTNTPPHTPPHTHTYVAALSTARTHIVRGTGEDSGSVVRGPPRSHHCRMVLEDVVVCLSGGSPWGFRLQGGAEHQRPLQVAKVPFGMCCDVVVWGAPCVYVFVCGVCVVCIVKPWSVLIEIESSVVMFQQCELALS